MYSQLATIVNYQYFGASIRIQKQQRRMHFDNNCLSEIYIFIPRGNSYRRLYKCSITKRALSVHETQQNVDFSRLKIISAHNKSDGLDESGIQFLQHAHRRRIHQLYNRGWSLWTKWCQQQHPPVSPREYEPKNVLRFLVAHQYYSHQYLNVLRSSIASVFNVIHKDKQPLANQQLIQNFSTAKKKSEVKLPSKQETSTWDLNMLLQYLVCHFQDNDSLSLTQLQDNVILLLCISTMFRPRSDIDTL